MQHTIHLRGTPVVGCCCIKDANRLFNFTGVRRKHIDDRPDLVRMNAPHACVAQLIPRLERRSVQGRLIAKFSHHTMRGHFAVRMGSTGKLQFGTHHQGVRKLAVNPHA